MIRSLLTITAVGFFCFSEACIADSPFSQDVPDLPPAASTIPEPGAGSLGGLSINTANVDSFKDLVIPELYPLIKDGSLEMEATRRLKYSWRLDDEAVRLSAVLKDIVDKDGNLRGIVPLNRGLLFGTYPEIKKSPDSSTSGAKVLWNIYSNWWGQKIVLFDFYFLSFKENTEYRKLGGQFARIYPSAVDPKDQTGQLLREKVSLTRPDVLAGFNFLTFRFRGSEEDGEWVFSPVNKKQRRVTGSNRADPLIKSALSLDDFLGWSGKVELVKASFQQDMVGLVPFPTLDLVDLVPNIGSCLEAKVPENDEIESKLRWNYETHKFPTAALWVPTSTVFVPRQLLKIELASNDPYSLYGRQIIYVDAFSMLPVYKIVNDRAGVPWKTVISSFGLASNKDHTVKAPFPAFMIIIDHKEGTYSIFDYIGVRYCNEYPENLKLSDFDPRKLGDVGEVK